MFLGIVLYASRQITAKSGNAKDQPGPGKAAHISSFSQTEQRITFWWILKYHFFPVAKTVDKLDSKTFFKSD